MSKATIEQNIETKQFSEAMGGIVLSNAFQFHDVMWQGEVRGIDCQYFDMYHITMWWIIENVLDTRSKQSRQDLSIIDFFTALFILYFHEKNVMEGGSFLS